MAHFARVEGIAGSQVVREVIVIANAAIENAPFPASEPIGLGFLAACDFAGEWVQTSYNANFRGKFAGVGDLWDGATFTAPPEDES